MTDLNPLFVPPPESPEKTKNKKTMVNMVNMANMTVKTHDLQCFFGFSCRPSCRPSSRPFGRHDGQHETVAKRRRQSPSPRPCGKRGWGEGIHSARSRWESRFEKNSNLLQITRSCTTKKAGFRSVRFRASTPESPSPQPLSP